MGTWGAGISSNDDYADIYSEFFELYNEGKDVADATALVLARNGEMLGMPEAVNNIWFALAKAQWECKQLQPEVYERVKTIIDSEADLQAWSELGATKSDIEKRRKALDKFLFQLQSAKPKAKARKKKVIRDPIFKKGECLTFELKNGNYGGAVILEAEYGTELGMNLVAVTCINQPQKPTLETFKSADVMIKNFASWDHRAEIIWISNYKPKEVNDFVNVIGTLEVKCDYLSSDVRHRYPYTSGWKSVLIEGTHWQFEHEKGSKRPERIIKIKSLLQRSISDRLFGK
jgi:hypothetical protein